jgi:GNAT superfamily N-acetyltransferase
MAPIERSPAADFKDRMGEIRRAADRDAPLLAELGARTFYEAYLADNAPEDMDAYVRENFTPEQQARELADPAVTYLVAFVSGRAVAYAKLRVSEVPPCVTGPRPVEVARLYVAKEEHGKGVAHVLFQACFDEARRAGHETLWLQVWDRNPRARAFYRKWGLEDVGEMAFLLGSELQSDRVLVKAIQRPPLPRRAGEGVPAPAP